MGMAYSSHDMSVHHRPATRSSARITIHVVGGQERRLADPPFAQRVAGGATFLGVYEWKADRRSHQSAYTAS